MQQGSFYASPNVDRRELLAWAEPVIADRVSDSYRRMARDADLDGLAVQHRRLWRNMLLDQRAMLPVSRKELQRLSETAGLPAGALEAVDQDVMEELLDIVLSRCQASRAVAKTFSRILLDAASAIGAAKAAA